MNIYTVSFFGHRQIENALEVENKLENIVHQLIVQNEYVDFLVGREGEFDLLASSVIKRAVTRYGQGNISFILVLPYMKAEYRDNEKSFLEYYDEVEICAEASQTHYKSAIQIRNRTMVNRSDLVVCYIEHKQGGAYKTIQYAEKQSCPIVNVANIS